MGQDLAARACVPCRGGVAPLDRAIAEDLLGAVPGWQLDRDGGRIERHYAFKTFAQALGFVNRVSALAEAEGHHPDVSFGWGYAVLTFQTHAIHGLHENDFIMAAKVDALDAGP